MSELAALAVADWGLAERVAVHRLGTDQVVVDWQQDLLGPAAAVDTAQRLSANLLVEFAE